MISKNTFQKERNYSEDNKNKINNNNNDEKILELLNDYNIEKTLGQGNFGKVKLGMHKITKEKVRK
jgi:serine/threonine protein kinase